jgi:tRNA A-37 threonylcarbamoyl transferase component Bud32
MVSKVIYENQICVKKCFSSNTSFEKEVWVYENVRNEAVNIPKLMKQYPDQKCTIIEYIDGELLLDVLDSYETRNDIKGSKNLLIELIEWVISFNSMDILVKSNLKQTDVNFRNFIISNGELYGFDFESVESVKSYSIIEHVLATYLLYDPKYSKHKKQVVNSIIFDDFLKNKNEACLNIKKEEMKISGRRELFRT